ncbi:MAG: lytic transglycosylase domain-containing protein [Saprospiraceae bacterium]
MYKFATTIFSTLGFVFACAFIFTSYSTDKNNDKAQSNKIANNSNGASLPQMVEPIRLSHAASFANEAMPQNMDTRERLDRELSVNAYWHSSTLLNIKNGAKFFPIIEPILAKNGVPDDFKYLAVAESSLRNVKSAANAKGFWQFRKLAAKEWGLEVNDEVDERYHVEKATEAACKYLKRLHKRFGSWANAAAAYNVGPTSFAKTLKKQGQSSFYDLNINEETNRYVFRLIAIKEIMSNPTNFGFYLNPEDMYEQLDNVYYAQVDKSVTSWAKWAEHNGLTYRMLKYYNPWLKSNKLTVVKKKYQIKLPRS